MATDRSETPSPAAIEGAARAVARFDAVMALPGLRDLWWAFALPDEAAALVRIQGGACSRTRLRLVAAGAQVERPSPDDQAGVIVLRGVRALYGWDGARPTERRLNAFSTAMRRAGRRPALPAAATATAIETARAGEPSPLLAAARAVAGLRSAGADRAVLAGSAGSLLAARGAAPQAALTLASGVFVPGERGGDVLTSGPDAFLQAVGAAADRHIGVLADLLESRRTARARIAAATQGAPHRQRGLRRDSGLLLSADALVGHEILTSSGLRAILARQGVPATRRTAQRLLDGLVAAGVAKEATGRRHFRVWVPTDLPLARLRADEAPRSALEQEPRSAAGGAQSRPLSPAPAAHRPDRNAEAAWREIARSGDVLIRDIQRAIAEGRKATDDEG